MHLTLMCQHRWVALQDDDGRGKGVAGDSLLSPRRAGAFVQAISSLHSGRLQQYRDVCMF